MATTNYAWLPFTHYKEAYGIDLCAIYIYKYHEGS
jgi:hypothetical protein